jgi:hypothetical protein
MRMALYRLAAFADWAPFLLPVACMVAMAL